MASASSGGKSRCLITIEIVDDPIDNWFQRAADFVVRYKIEVCCRVALGTSPNTRDHVARRCERSAFALRSRLRRTGLLERSSLHAFVAGNWFESFIERDHCNEKVGGEESQIEQEGSAAYPIRRVTSSPVRT
jgi:hypothetical protein